MDLYNTYLPISIFFILMTFRRFQVHLSVFVSFYCWIRFCHNGFTNLTVHRARDGSAARALLFQRTWVWLPAHKAVTSSGFLGHYAHVVDRCRGRQNTIRTTSSERTHCHLLSGWDCVELALLPEQPMSWWRGESSPAWRGYNPIPQELESHITPFGLGGS